MWFCSVKSRLMVECWRNRLAVGETQRSCCCVFMCGSPILVQNDHFCFHYYACILALRERESKSNGTLHFSLRNRQLTSTNTTQAELSRVAIPLHMGSEETWPWAGLFCAQPKDLHCPQSRSWGFWQKCWFLPHWGRCYLRSGHEF